MKNSLKSVPLLIVLFCLDQAAAIPPPDLIITAIQSAMQMFGVVVAFSLSAFFFLGDYIKASYYNSPKRFVCIVSILGIIILAGIFYYARVQS